MSTCGAQARKQDRKLERVALTVSLRGIRVVETASTDIKMDFNIYRFQGIPQFSYPFGSGAGPKLFFGSSLALGPRLGPCFQCYRII